MKYEKYEVIFFNFISKLSHYGAAPTIKEFFEIIAGRNEKRDNPLDDFLREKTVKKHPCLDNLPITAFMKKTMVELPEETKEIMSIYNSLHKTDKNIDSFASKFAMENKSWFNKLEIKK